MKRSCIIGFAAGLVLRVAAGVVPAADEVLVRTPVLPVRVRAERKADGTLDVRTDAPKGFTVTVDR